jgi:DNA-directed RNA polymerase subunit RPC12/RpoP
MKQPLHTGRLVLTPQDPYMLPDEPEALLTRLHEIGLIDGVLQGELGYLLGERFMQLVNFMGCSPYIRLQPGRSNEPFCHLRLDGPHSRPILLYGKNTQPPRCETCRKRLSDWQASFESWLKSANGWQSSCPHCGHRQDPVTYDFRQSAGCGRLFLFIENIFPQEAIPSAALLDTLKQACNEKAWRYFYQQD